MITEELEKEESIEQRKNQITEGVIWKQLLLFFFPILFGTFFQQLYNTADAVIVGRYVGKEALSAVGGSTATIIGVIVGFFMGLSGGATVIVSQYYGAKRADMVKRAVHTAFAFCLLGSLVLMAIGIPLAPAILRAMGTPEDVLPLAISYIRIYFLGTAGNLLYNIGAAILRAAGDSKRPLYFLIASCFVNIVMDLLFVVVLDMGVAGAGWATILSQLISAVMVITVLMKSNDMYRLIPGEIRLEREMLQKIVHYGFPTGIQSTMYSFSNLLIQTKINALGTDTVAAWTAYSKIDCIFWMIVGAFGISVTTFVGQNYGAGKLDRVRKGMKTCLLMTFVTTIFLSTALYFWGYNFYYLFTTDDSVMAIGVTILKFLSPMYIAYVLIEILSGTLRGTGDCWVPTVICCVGICGLRVLWLTFAVPVHNSVYTVALSYPLTWVTTSLSFLIYYCFFSKIRRESKAAKAVAFRTEG